MAERFSKDAPSAGGEPLPLYSCLILQTADDRYVLERRPASAARAAGLITCFGGTREAGESPDECLVRELDEELGWRPTEYLKVVELWRGGLPLAWFYHARFPHSDVPEHRETGHTTVLLKKAELLVPPLSPWHAAAFRGHFSSELIVHVDKLNF